MRTTTYTCDRCGKDFDPDQDGVHVSLSPTGLIRVWERPLEDKDLCLDCIDAFEQWLKGYILTPYTPAPTTVDFKVSAAIVDRTIERLNESTRQNFRQDGPLASRD